MAKTKNTATANGMSQAEATRKLAGITRSIRAALKGIGEREFTIGSKLLEVRDSGLAVAAADGIEDGERDWSADGRSTAVSKYVADNFPELSRQRANEYLQAAERRGQLEAAGIDPTPFKASTFRAVKSDATAEQFTAVVADMLASESGKLTAKAFVEAGREAGIVPPANGGGSGDPFRKACNAMLVELRKVEGPLTKAQRTQLDAIVDAIVAVTSV